MPIDRWDPFRDLMQVQKRMNRLFESALAGATALDAYGPVGWRPPADVLETDEAVEISVELPGLRRDDIQIEIGDGTLTVHGERKQARDSEEGRFFQLERSYGPFARQFRLPESVARDQIAASYRQGVLHVTLPKRPEARARPIRVVIDGS
jgi:HSP20 family protein